MLNLFNIKDTTFVAIVIYKDFINSGWFQNRSPNIEIAIFRLNFIFSKSVFKVDFLSLISEFTVGFPK